VIEEGARQREFTCKKLSCALCRAPPQKTHGKAIAVRFLAFAVRPRRTAKHVFPVVTSQWVFCCFAGGSAGASLLNSNILLSCESLLRIFFSKDEIRN
jgi:hypothetical protein